MNIYENTLIEILKDKKDWISIKNNLSIYNSNESISTSKTTLAGKLFEYFAKYYFLIAPEEKDNFRNVWLFDEIPLEIKKRLDLGNLDYGVDLLLENFNGKIFAVQCKFKNDEKLKLSWSKDKIPNLFAFCPKADGYIVFTNVSDIDHVSSSRYENFMFYGLSNLLEIENSTIINIYNHLTKNPENERKLFQPFEHQKIAIQNCIDFFEIEKRGQLILPCGAGKTLTALWIKEGLKSNFNLVLVPSLALLKQIKNDWIKQRSIKYQYLCVCSENDIDNDNTDSIITHTYEIGSNVTTDSIIIRKFIEEQNHFVIFSTYQSLIKISDAIIGLQNFEFDFIFCDESHKTAGVGNNSFSLIHDNNKIPAKRRLYATATPRIVKESLKKKIEDELQYSYDMNDPEVFGEEFYRMTFKDAIEKNILVDYKIVAIGVNDQDLKDYIDERRYVDLGISIDEIANNYALQFVMSKYSSNHALTFHSRVKYAREFTERHSNLYSDIKCFHVNGEQSTSIRNIILNEFKNTPKSIISNSRCLTEGVDVPAIDLVYFCDPKNSKIDIIQAVGRALRKKDGKKLGLIVIPIYHLNNNSIEDSIDKSSFKNLLQVIRSLCDQDERLQDEINNLAYSKGKRNSQKIEIVNFSFIEEQSVIELIGFEDKLKNALFDQIIDKSSNNWDIYFLQLNEFISKFGEYPTKEDNIELFNWISKQRSYQKNGRLSNDKIKKLNSISFIWDIHDRKWDFMFDKLVEYKKINDFEPSNEENPELYSWFRKQKIELTKNNLSKEKAKKMNSITFLGSANRYKWLVQYDKLVEFRNFNPNKWPTYNRKQQNSDESQLSVFCQIIRKKFRNNVLEDFWFEKFVDIDFNFEGKIDNWKDTYSKLVKYIKLNNHFPKTKSKIYNWSKLQLQQLQDGKLNSEQIKLLEIIDLENLYRESNQSWLDCYQKIKEFKNSNGKLPTFLSDKKLCSWIGTQKIKYKKDELLKDQIIKLEEIGVIWDWDEVRKDKWNLQFEKLKEFKKNNPNSSPSYKIESEKTLYLWMQTQRQVYNGTLTNRNQLSVEKIKKLNSIGFDWKLEEIIDKKWEFQFKKLKLFLENNTINELQDKINGKVNPLYMWFYRERIKYFQGKLDENKVVRYLEIGIDLNKSLKLSKGLGKKNRWLKSLELFKNFTKEKKRLPSSISEDNIEYNLYKFYKSTKKAYLKGNLTEEQIISLKELPIILESLES